MDARRTLIADSALRVIGERGIRGLTHRAVDDVAELPAGSTSYYCRRRVDLMSLTLERLYVLDGDDIAATAKRISAGARDAAAITREVSALVVRWLAPPDRIRTIARFELFLAASHEPELQFLLAGQLAGVVALTEAVTPVLPGGESPRPEQRIAILMLAEGLMLANVRQGLPTPSQDDVERIMGTLDPQQPA